MSAAQYLSEKEKTQIVQAIKEAEKHTSGEIRVHIERKCREDVLDHAAFIFDKLGMFNTAARNGVLIYLAMDDHKFAIIGDVGINSKVAPDFWDETKSEMLKAFQLGDIVNGIAQGARQVGKVLKKHFPYQSDDFNELPDEISFGI